jgi:type II secretory pathway pseudopilin PulG
MMSDRSTQSRSVRAPAQAGQKLRRLGPSRLARTAVAAALGMTLIEMLVSVSILTVMILAFSTILVQAQRVISVSQTSRRSKAMAFSIARVIRRDFRRISQNGFLAICNLAGNDDVARKPLLVFTTAGTTPGTISTARGAGGLVCYSLCDNAAGGKQILWRPQYVLSQFQTPADLTVSADRINMPFSNLQLFPRTIASPTVSNSLIAIPPAIPNLIPTGANQVRIPPKNGNDINNLWQALVMECSDLSITWTDGAGETVGSLGSNLRWFGIDPHRPTGGTQTGTLKSCADAGIVGVEEPGYPGAFSYYALFTHDNQKIWPRAVKIRFKIFEKGMPEEFRGADGSGGMEYEVICNIGE